MNVKLLRKVKKHILAEPKRLDMDTLGHKVDGQDAPACQTAACIAGWACVLTHGRESVSFGDAGTMRVAGSADLWTMARVLLGLNGFESNALFREPANARDERNQRYGWPEKFSSGYLKAKTAKARAKVTAARIEHFIKTEGRE